MVKGGNELLEAVIALQLKSVAKQKLALEAAAEIVEKNLQPLVPTDTHEMSVEVGHGKVKSRKSTRQIDVGLKGTTLHAKGSDNHAYAGHFVDFGTIHQKGTYMSEKARDMSLEEVRQSYISHLRVDK